MAAKKPRIFLLLLVFGFIAAVFYTYYDVQENNYIQPLPKAPEVTNIKLSIEPIQQFEPPFHQNNAELKLKVVNDSGHDIVVKGNDPISIVYSVDKFDEATQTWQPLREIYNSFNLLDQLVKPGQYFEVAVSEFWRRKWDSPRGPRVGIYFAWSPQQPSLSYQVEENPQLQGGYVYKEIPLNQIP